MVKIWGLDLHDMQWGKFKSSYMFGNTEFHLRRTKFVVYQCAMIFTVVSESLGTAALSDYIDQQKYVEKHNIGASIDNNNFIGAFSYNIFVGIYVATIFGSAFFFDLFWPRRYESPGVKLSWRICSVLACVFTLSAGLTCTIILATSSAHVTGRDAQQAKELLARTKPHQPLDYKDNARGIASVCFLWPGFVATVISTIIMWLSLSHNDHQGPLSTHAQAAEKRHPLGSTPTTPGARQTSGVDSTNGGVRAPEPVAQSATAPAVPAQQHNMYPGA